MYIIYCLLVSIFCCVLSACSNEHHFAPVMEVNAFEAIPKTGGHRVIKGETLYEIAWRYGMDYRFLAERNQIDAPYAIHPGQIIYLRQQSDIKSATIEKFNVATISKKLVSKKVPPISSERVETQAKPVKQFQTRAQTNLYIKEPNYSVSYWIWPARGKILDSFSTINKGININGREGQDIFATAPGKVVYAGNGLRGYGNLIILKHNNLYLSAYAHTRNITVSEGQWVGAGQKIAEMGHTGADQIMLHFEIRRAGKPIDPSSLLQ